MAKTGRPLTLSQEHINKVNEYYNLCLSNEDEIPFKEQLELMYLDTTPQTIIEWQIPHELDNDEIIELREQFGEAIVKLERLQSWRLQDKGLNNKVHVGMASLILQSKHDFSPKNTIEDKSKKQNRSNINKIAGILTELKEEVKR